MNLEDWNRIAERAYYISAIEDFKRIVEIVYYFSAIFAALAALYIYYRNSKLERSRWASTLFEKFYENDQYKQVRSLLDSSANSPQAEELVLREEAQFTDYLNFFEYVAFLADSKQLRRGDVEALFDYYLKCLKRHDRVKKYVDNPANGYERLSKLLKDKKLSRLLKR